MSETTEFPGVWAGPDADVASGRIPGYVGAVRIGGHVETRVAGHMAVEPAARPWRTTPCSGSRPSRS